MGIEKKIKITVKIIGHLEQYISGDQNELGLKLNNDSRVIDLLKNFEIPEEEIKFIMILVNGQPAKKETLLNSGDRVSLLTLADGG
ncbi:MAG: MoaD/ThiS family protein [Halarsenatibacteraceae bacterium]